MAMPDFANFGTPWPRHDGASKIPREANAWVLLGGVLAAAAVVAVNPKPIFSPYLKQTGK